MNEIRRLKREDILYPSESYKIGGALFDVYNELGPGHHEKYYQRAVAHTLETKQFKFIEQVYAPLMYKGEIIGKNYFDFLIEDKIILELKKGDHFSKRHIDQVLEYLKVGGHGLALLANFGKNNVSVRRLVNFNVIKKIR